MTDAENALKEAEREKKALNTYALVVNEKNDSSAEYLAAKELNKYLLRMTGREYTICTAEESELGYDKRCHYISVGDNAIFRESPYKRFGGITAEDGFFVKADGNSLFIGGNSDRAIFYGAYELLRTLGCDFYTADCEYVPVGVTIEAAAIDIVSLPSVTLRQYLAYETCYDHTEAQFAVKSGVNTLRMRRSAENSAERYASVISARIRIMRVIISGKSISERNIARRTILRWADTCPALRMAWNIARKRANFPLWHWRRRV